MKSKINKYDENKEYFFVEGCFINELSNSENDEDVSIARARVKPGVTTSWHSLKKTTERYVILEGKGKVELGDRESEIVTEGDVVIIPQDVQQRITNIGSSDLVFLAICSPRFREDFYVDVSQED